MSEGSSSGGSEDVEEDSVFMLCGLCKKPPVNTSPKLLPCLHSFCFKCLEERFSEQQQQEKAPSTTASSSNSTSSLPRLKCPTCGQEFLVPPKGVHGFLDNQFALENIGKLQRREESSNRVCTSCEDNSPATSYCLNCTDWLCDACVSAHQRVRVTKDHRIQTEDDYLESSESADVKPIFCHTHPQESLKLFCANCEKLTCRDCQLLEHKDHKYQFIREAAVGYRDFLRGQLNRLYEQAQPLTDSIREVEKAAKGLQEREDSIKSEITKASEMLVKAVKKRENVLLTELKTLVHFKHKLLAKQNKDLRLMQKILQHNYGFTRHVLKNGSDMGLLYTKRQLSSRIQNLLSLKYNVLPVAHSDLKFSVEAEKLCSVIGKLGCVMTPADRSNVNNSKPDATFRGLSSASYAPLPSATVSAAVLKRPGSLTTTGRLNPIEALSAVNNRLVTGNGAATNLTYSNSKNPSLQAAIVHPSGANITVNSKVGIVTANSVSRLALASGLRALAKTGIGVANNGIPVPPRSVSVGYSPTVKNTSPRSFENGNTLPLRHFQDLSNRIVKSPPRPASTGSSSSHHSVSPLSDPGGLQRQNGWEEKASTSDPPSQVLKGASSPKGTEAAIPKLLPILKRSNSSQGLPDPVPPEPSLSPTVRVKQEKPDSPVGFTPCSESIKPQQQEESTSGESGIDETSSNDDWCAVCRNGGELLCCDTCPRVFHLPCHVPYLPNLPNDAWSCGLCRKVDWKALQQKDKLTTSPGNKRRSSSNGLTEYERKVCEKILLELYCHSDSIPFQQKVSKSVPNYYKVISHPMDLSTVRAKLQTQNFQHYQTFNEFVVDCRLIFENCAMFNDVSSEVGQMGRNLEVYFDTVLKKYLPDYTDPAGSEPRSKRKKDDGKAFILN